MRTQPIISIPNTKVKVLDGKVETKKASRHGFDGNLFLNSEADTF